MIDFYLISDEQAKPNKLLELKWAGRINELTIEQLIEYEVVDSRFDVNTDFRWGTSMVQKLYKMIMDKNLNSVSEIEKIMQVLELAYNNQSGLIAYCD